MITIITNDDPVDQCISLLYESPKQKCHLQNIQPFVSPPQHTHTTEAKNPAPAPAPAPAPTASKYVSK